MKPILTASEAADEIRDGDSIVVGGTGAVVDPDTILAALEQRFLESQHPADLVVISPFCPGDRPGEGGLNCVAHEGMLRRIVTASLVPARHPRLL